jgi:hypothetical protein
MWKRRYAVLGLFIAAQVSLAGTGALSIKVTALDPIVTSGTKIIVKVTTTNHSNRSITYHDTQPDCDYSFTVLTETGTPARETDLKRTLACGGEFKISGRDILVTLKPSESHDDELELTHLYDMSNPGEYSIQVERTFPEIGHFRSNTLSIKVTK